MPAKQQQNGTAPTSADKWREAREKGVLFHFPSGFTALIRPVNVGTFIRLGRIPDVLTGLVSQLINGQVADVNSIETMRNLSEIYDIFCETCFVSPKVVKELSGAPDEILAEDIADTDKQTLFALMGSPASALARFRTESAQPVDAVVGQSGGASSTE